LKDNTEGFSYVKPIHQLEHRVHKAGATDDQLNQFVKGEIKLPKEMDNKNMVMEVLSGDLQKFLTFYSNDLKVNILEQYGELKVTNVKTGKPLPKTYVKVFYQKKQGGEAFFRDGYTDIRGMIEYSQTSGDKLKDVKRFAILVVHDEFGSKIMECDPPKDVQGNSQAVAGHGQPGGFNMMEQKMNRLMDRQSYVKSKAMPMMKGKGKY
jgi:hypothetical protein